MNKFFTTVAAAAIVTIFAAKPATAQGAVVADFDKPFVVISGGVDIVSQYVLRDAYAATPEPANQGYASLSFVSYDYGEFSLNLWGSKGISTDIGDELDVGVSWKKSIGEDMSVKFAYNRFIINDAPEMDEYTITVSKGDFDASYTHYTWHEGMEDGKRVNVGYNYSLSDSWSGRFDLTGETGLGLSDAIIVGADLNYAVADNVSLGATILVPFTEDDDGRDVEFIGSIGYSF